MASQHKRNSIPWRPPSGRHDELARQLGERARADGKTVNAVITDAVTAWLGRQDRIDNLSAQHPAGTLV